MLWGKSAARAASVALAGALTLLAGCGHSQIVVRTSELGIGITEYRLNPQNVRVSAGALTIIVHNFGRLTHNLVLVFNGHREASTQPIPPGQVADLTVTLTKGTYTMASTIMSDQALGTYGTLTVG
jgi:plastocyanin